MDISIHALVKRATIYIWITGPVVVISIHALVKRATCFNRYVTRQRNDFNPRPRKEGDPLETVEGKASCLISIHALVKRATSVSRATQGTLTISIHALVKRATAKCLITMSRLRISIHALVKRATILVSEIRACIFDFNPRPRKEGDYA